MATSSDYNHPNIEASDEVRDIFCEPCELDGRHTEAKGFCVDCSEYLCGECYRKHTLYKAFRNHVLQDMANVPQNIPGYSMHDYCLQKCMQHPNKIIEYFCRSCNSLGCHACITINHRSCKHVEFIPNIVTSQQTIEELTTFTKELNRMCEQVSECKRQISSTSYLTDKWKNEAKTELKKQHAEIKKFVDGLEMKKNKEIEEIHKRNTSVLKSVSDTCESIDKDLKGIEDDIETKQKTGQHCEAFIAMIKSKSNLGKIESEYHCIAAEHELKKYKLSSSNEMKDLMTKMTEVCKLEAENVSFRMDIANKLCKWELIQPDTISKAHSTKSITHTDETTKTDISSKIMTTVKEHPNKKIDSPESYGKTSRASKTANTTARKTLRFETEIDVSSGNDNMRPHIIGLAIIHKHYIVALDYTNFSVKVFETRDKKMTSEMTFRKAIVVCNVTNVKDDKIAVTYDDKIQLLSVSKSGKLSKDVIIDIDDKCYSIVYNNGKFIVKSACGELYIVDMQGKVIKRLGRDSEGQKLFSPSYSLAINAGNNTIYVSDHVRNTVTSMTLDGKINALYKDIDMRCSRGITVDDEGNVYACSTGTNSIYQLSADCNKLQEFPGVSGSHAICSNTNKLYIGIDGTISVYEIM